MTDKQIPPSKKKEISQSPENSNTSRSQYVRAVLRCLIAMSLYILQSTGSGSIEQNPEVSERATTPNLTITINFYFPVIGE